MSADHDFEGADRPRKRLRPEDLPPQTSPPAQADTPALNNLTHHDEFWFEDGSIILVAGNTGFRVYRALLAAQSTIFADMFSSSSSGVEEIVDQRPVVYLSDSPKDLAHFLRVLLPKYRRT